MATYQELYNLTADQSLIARVSIAIAVAVNRIRTESTEDFMHAARIGWSKGALLNTDSEARKIIWLLLAENRELSVEQILNATDAEIQNATNNALSILVG